MIVIINVSKEPKLKGVHEYEVRINREVICKFKHKREEGLDVCLTRAAKAVEEIHWKQLELFFDTKGDRR